MTSADLYIIAAGNGSRMRSDLPKALVPITDIPNLTTTLQQIGHKFKNVFVAINNDVASKWEAYAADTLEKFPGLLDNVTFVKIFSGLGDGHAVMQVLANGNMKLIDKNLSTDIVVCWGDVFIPHAEIVDELLSHRDMISGVIPVVREENPYVTVLTDSNMLCVSADFSKYGEKHTTGFHDQSIFRFDAGILFESLLSLHNSMWKNGRYITQGGELSLLYTFHHLYNSGSPLSVFETEYPTMSFNTPEEVAQIQEEIKSKWNTAHS